MDDLMTEVKRRAGGVKKLATALNLTHPTVVGWRRVPAHHAVAVSRITGISTDVLRPDVFGPPASPADAA